MIPFNIPPYTGNEDQHVLAAMRSSKMSGDGEYTRRCERWFQDQLRCYRALLTPSCTHALEMAALLLDIRPGDEVIMPSYTFVSTANAFALRGAKIVFVDIRPDTHNIDERKVEEAITANTRAIVPVHYAGVSADMAAIMDIAQRHDLFVVEDAAQAMMASYKGQLVGSRGHMAAYSFHETKNYTSAGEGGLLIINDERFVERAEIIREKGTNRSQFFRGMVDKYSWVDIGSSYLPSDVQAAYLWGQLEMAEAILEDRIASWSRYYNSLLPLAERGQLELPSIPEDVQHNGHMFYIKVRDLEQRTDLIAHLADQGVHAVFHYVPLHTAKAGERFGRFSGTDNYTTQESERLIRLPMWYGLTSDAIDQVTSALEAYFQ